MWCAVGLLRTRRGGEECPTVREVRWVSREMARPVRGAGTPGTLHPLETLPQMKGSTVIPHLEAHGSGWKKLREPPSLLRETN